MEVFPSFSDLQAGLFEKSPPLCEGSDFFFGVYLICPAIEPEPARQEVLIRNQKHEFCAGFTNPDHFLERDHRVQEMLQ